MKGLCAFPSLLEFAISNSSLSRCHWKHFPLDILFPSFTIGYLEPPPTWTSLFLLPVCLNNPGVLNWAYQRDFIPAKDQIIETSVQSKSSDNCYSLIWNSVELFPQWTSQTGYNKQRLLKSPLLVVPHLIWIHVMKPLVVKAVPKLNITLQYNSFGFTFAASVRLVENNNKTMVQAQAINKSD